MSAESRSPTRLAGLLPFLLAAACSGGSGDSAAQVAMLRHWNQIAIDASGLDHTPEGEGPPHVYGEQHGPCRASRAMAIVHLAIFEAANAVQPRYTSYLGLAPAAPGTSIQAAVAQAAHDTLCALFPSQQPIFTGYLEEELDGLLSGIGRQRGIALGKAAAAAILELRADDGSDHEEPRIGVDHFPSDEPGKWRQDPISLHPLALGARWNEVRPFVLESAQQFRCEPPPALSSEEYAFAYDQVKLLGGDGETTPTVRNEEQTLTGIFWAYDGMPSLCAPPRLYNQIASRIAAERGLELLELARLLALVNVAMADAGIALWESKYHYAFWRPVTGIRESDPGSGPTGAGDGNAATQGDPSFTPLGAPTSNHSGPSFTPPFPAYPSGHAGFGGALFQTLRRFFGTDEIAFTFVSDELNGLTLDNEGVARPLLPRSYATLTEAEEENGQSRIYLGIHWRFDKTAGIAQGRSVADHVFDALFQPLE